MLYPILKWLHVLLAVTAIGANITYGIWLSRGAANREHLAFTLRGVKILDDRLANPAYGLLLITGLAMTFVGGIPLSTPWISLALTLYIVLLLIGIFGYSPTLRRQVTMAEAGETQSEAFAALARRGTILGIVLAVLALAITFLMVVKPPLWAA